MNVGVKIDGTMVLIILGVAVVGYAVYKKNAILTAIDPTSSKNIAYSTANDIVAQASNGKYNDLGQAIADTKNTNPVSGAIASVFDWIGHTTGQLPAGVNN